MHCGVPEGKKPRKAAPCLHEGAIPPSFSHRAKPVNEMERSGIEYTAEFQKRKSRKPPHVRPCHRGTSEAPSRSPATVKKECIHHEF